jgi:hypothetical protein
VVASKRTTWGEPSMGEVSTIGLDIANPANNVRLFA